MTMFGHPPTGYACPFCSLVAGADSAVSDQEDIVARTDNAIAFIAARWWPNNHGHVLVLPVEHHENLYDLPTRCGHAVHDSIGARTHGSSDKCCPDDESDRKVDLLDHDLDLIITRPIGED